MNNHLNRGLLFTAVLMISACSHNPSVGEQMIHQGKDTEAMGEKWEDGNELVKKGRTKVKKGENLMHKGQSQADEGKTMIRKGNVKMKNSKTNFQDEHPDVAIEE